VYTIAASRRPIQLGKYTCGSLLPKFLQHQIYQEIVHNLVLLSKEVHVEGI
jgi:hypothetical protein